MGIPKKNNKMRCFAGKDCLCANFINILRAKLSENYIEKLG